VRKRIFEIIEVSSGDDLASRVYDWCMMATILVSLIPLATKSTAPWTVAVDKITVAVFIVDYLLRLWTADFKLPRRGRWAFVIYPVTPMALIDLLTILPSFGVISRGARVLRIFRLFRTFKVFRVVKFVRYSKNIEIILSVLRQPRGALLTVGALAGGYILISALIVFNVEPDTFNTFFDAIYWSTISLTTVGYGDIYPVSTAGRIFTMLSSMVGIAIVALPAGIITAGYMDAVSASEK
jgi:voltage-gated potassium channel